MPDPTVNHRVQLAADLRLDSGDLDEVVHDVAGRAPSRINNDGLVAQITFLTDELGAGEAERVIRDAASHPQQ